MSDFCEAIKKLSEHCQFGTTLYDALRDRLLYGSATITHGGGLNVRPSHGYSAGRRDSDKRRVDLRKALSAVAESVNKLKARSQQPRTSATGKTSADLFCFFCCGRNNHDQSSCYFKGKFCLQCSQKGHTQKMCKTKVVKSYKKGKVNLMNDHSEATSD